MTFLLTLAVSCIFFVLCWHMALLRAVLLLPALLGHRPKA